MNEEYVSWRTSFTLCQNVLPATVAGFINPIGLKSLTTGLLDRWRIDSGRVDGYPLQLYNAALRMCGIEDQKMKSLSSAVEDYLKAIYEIQREEGHDRVSTSALADKMNVTRASVTGMLKKLSAWDPQLIHYERYYGVRLTPAGEKIALEVIRHHRLLELYLTEALGFSWDEVDSEADRLEHVISENLEKRIAARLGDPKLDPHGAPIPDMEGNLPQLEETRLTDLKIGRQACISRVLDDDPAALRYLREIEFHLGAVVEVVERLPLSDTIDVRVIGTDDIHTLQRALTNRVFVSSVNLGK